MLRRTVKDLRELPANAPADVILRLALQLHAEVVRIHPFEDGNGRTSRVLMNIILVRFSLPAVSFDSPKQEYLTCMERYLASGDAEALIDLALGLLANAR